MSDSVLMSSSIRMVVGRVPRRRWYVSFNERLKPERASSPLRLSAEGKDLFGQIARPLGCFHDLRDVLARALLVYLVEGKLGVAEDDREHVVEVVSDAARERAHGLHLLRLAKLLLESLLFSDVPGEVAGKLTSSELDAGADDLHGKLAAVFATMDGLAEKKNPFPDCLPARFYGLRSCSGVDVEERLSDESSCS